MCALNKGKLHFWQERKNLLMMFLGCQNSLPWGRVVFVSTWRRHDAQSLAGQVCHTTKSLILNDFEHKKTTDWECQKSEDAPLGRATGSNPHLPTAEFPLAAVSKMFFNQSMLFFPFLSCNHYDLSRFLPLTFLSCFSDV